MTDYGKKRKFWGWTAVILSIVTFLFALISFLIANS